MKLKDKHQINNDTWNKLKKSYNILFLLGIPFAASVFAFITWPIIDNFSWTLVPIIPGFVLYVMVLAMRDIFFTKSKYTIFVTFLSLSLFTYFFAVTANACAFRFWGYSGLITQNAILILIGIFLCRHYYQYYERVWESHKYNNENVVLDQENGRYDFLNNFNLDEKKVKGKMDKQYSNSALTSLIYISAPVGVGISLLFSKGDDYTIPIIIGWILSVPVTLGFTKVLVGAFYIYRKLVYFEKKLGKPIINGLLR